MKRFFVSLILVTTMLAHTTAHAFSYGGILVSGIVAGVPIAKLVVPTVRTIIGAGMLASPWPLITQTDLRGREFGLLLMFLMMTGAVLLDENGEPLPFAQLDSSADVLTGMTPVEREAFNNERPHFNALLDQVVHEQAAESLATEVAHRRLVELAEAELSREAFSAYNKIKQALKHEMSSTL